MYIFDQYAEQLSNRSKDRAFNEFTEQGKIMIEAYVERCISHGFPYLQNILQALF